MKITGKQVWRYARIVIGVVLVGILIPQILKPEFWTTLATVNVPLVGLALVLSIASVASKSWRWGVVMRWRGINLSQGYLLLSYFISMFFNNFLPSGMGGDAVRAYETARHTGRSTESITAIVIERGSGMLSVFAAGSLFALTVPTLPLPVALIAHGLFLGVLVGTWALWLDITGRILNAISAILPARLRGVWAKIILLYEEFRMYRHEWRLLGTLMVQSVITLAVSLASIYCLLLAFKSTPSFGGFVAAVSIVTAIDILPISLNGLGVRENSYVYFLGIIGVPGTIALGVAILIRLLVFIQAAFGGVAFVVRNLQNERKNAVLPLEEKSLEERPLEEKPSLL